MRATWAEVRDAEFQAIHGRAPGPDHAAATFAENQAALCLSGGGIRSAAFCLGVLQALQAAGLLTRFHYLSTVSGGGYIGSWLQALRLRLGALTGGGLDSSEIDRAIAGLRRFTSYLTPRRGFMSLDTWAGATLYLRNLLINWMLLLPAMMAVTVTAILDRTAFWWLLNPRPDAACQFSPPRAPFCWDCNPPGALMRYDPHCPVPPGVDWHSVQHWVAVGCWIVAGGCLFSGIVWAALCLPSHRAAETPARVPRYATPKVIRNWIVVPGLVWAFLTPLGAAPWYDALSRGPTGWQLTLPVAFWGLCVLGFAVAAALSARTDWTNAIPAGLVLVCAGLGWGAWAWGLPGWPALYGLVPFAVAAMVLGVIDHLSSRRMGAFVFNLWAWVLAAAVGGALAWLGLWFAKWIPPGVRAERMVVLAPVWLVLCQVLVSTMYVAIRREVSNAEIDREWLARMSAQKLRIAVLWGAYAAATLILSRFGLWEDAAQGKLAAAMGAGPIAAWLGKQAMTKLEALGGQGFRVPWTMALNVLAFAFAVALAAFLGLAADLVLTQLQDGLRLLGSVPDDAPLTERTMFSAQFGLILALVLLTWLQARRVNVNRFSMHGVYRNRLMRAFLGAARGRRARDRFTGFDTEDDVRLHQLQTNTLFPVLGMTLNLAATVRTDWADRKGAAFTATPLHCGSAVLGRRGAYIASDRYAGRDFMAKRGGNRTPGGLTLATAMTISGAAVSPNWGYHTSPPLAFLMTMFNVRLGAWLPNPAVASAEDLTLAKPPNALTPFLLELAGWTTDGWEAIYLSDGGHFDNLGLYEMLRRRCPVIVVVDADADPDCKLFDLGQTLRQAEIDLGVRVAFEQRLWPRNTRGTAPVGGVGFGTIAYPDTAIPGVLVYLKPDCPADLPVAIEAYAAEDDTFPHQTTADQWFTESQFESYRALGEFQAASLLARAQGPLWAVLGCPANHLAQAQQELRSTVLGPDGAGRQMSPTSSG